MASEMHLQLIAGLLRRGKALDRLSSALTLLALVIGLGPLLGFMALTTGGAVCVLLLVCGLLQKYYALRVALDAELFAQAANDPTQLTRRTAELDKALLTLGSKADQGSRSWEQRGQGALRLLRLQALWLGLQMLIALAAIVLMPWLSHIRFG
ncbi:hypothetical protein SAMN05216588_103345 [Pseudomonas flavescens]|uniref:Transmembrane protein n=1 Tax=Phytopseudomonas flavescens TaxID=29435 RepID=A0A1G8AWF1_9GAMM|nr:hypothetical protein [Pseudomonas flavescens]SDH25332.1 hypothetical protein SAMN05216588_103345 [Pseudomonas flavescens]